MTVREDAVEALLMEGSTNGFEHYSDFCNMQEAERLCTTVLTTVFMLIPSLTHEMACLEAAQLLEEGWNPKDKVVPL